ncbi:MAG: hypothetical protein ACOCQQ_01730 [Candidatus Nanoarchaeia archaeon]
MEKFNVFEILQESKKFHSQNLNLDKPEFVRVDFKGNVIPGSKITTGMHKDKARITFHEANRHAKNHGVDPEILQKAVRYYDPAKKEHKDLTEHIARNLNTKDKTLKLIAEKTCSKECDLNNLYKGIILNNVAIHKNASAHTLSWIHENAPKEHVEQSLALNPKTPKYVLQDIFNKTENKKVMYNVVKNPNCTKELWQSAVNDRPDLLNAAKSNMSHYTNKVDHTKIEEQLNLSGLANNTKSKSGVEKIDVDCCESLDKLSIYESLLSLEGKEHNIKNVKVLESDKKIRFGSIDANSNTIYINNSALKNKDNIVFEFNNDFDKRLEEIKNKAILEGESGATAHLDFKRLGVAYETGNFVKATVDHYKHEYLYTKNNLKDEFAKNMQKHDVKFADKMSLSYVSTLSNAKFFSEIGTAVDNNLENTVHADALAAYEDTVAKLTNQKTKKELSNV